MAASNTPIHTPLAPSPEIEWGMKFHNTYNKRITYDRACWADLCGVVVQQLTKVVFQQRVKAVLGNAWAIFEAEYKDTQKNDGSFKELRQYHVDDVIVLLIISIESRPVFITCYHKGHPAGHGDNNEPAGNNRLRFLNKILKPALINDDYREFFPIKGFPEGYWDV